MKDNRYEYSRHKGRPQDELPADVATMHVVKDYRRMYDQHKQLMQSIGDLRRQNADLRLQLALATEARRNAMLPHGRNGKPLHNPQKVVNVATSADQLRQRIAADLKNIIGWIPIEGGMDGDACELMRSRLRKVRGQLATLADYTTNVVKMVKPLCTDDEPVEQDGEGQ